MHEVFGIAKLVEAQPINQVEMLATAGKRNERDQRGTTLPQRVFSRLSGTPLRPAPA